MQHNTTQPASYTNYTQTTHKLHTNYTHTTQTTQTTEHNTTNATQHDTRSKIIDQEVKADVSLTPYLIFQLFTNYEQSQPYIYMLSEGRCCRVSVGSVLEVCDRTLFTKYSTPTQPDVLRVFNLTEDGTTELLYESSHKSLKSTDCFVTFYYPTPCSLQSLSSILLLSSPQSLSI